MKTYLLLAVITLFMLLTSCSGTDNNNKATTDNNNHMILYAKADCFMPPKQPECSEHFHNLYLQIHTPQLKENRKNPVIVWLYDNTEAIPDRDVIVVTVNYRKNIQGFLDLSAFGEKYAKSGNVGLLDLIAALTWIKNNIYKYGGDSSNVTIAGQSDSATEVLALTGMPIADGLFHKVIIQSASPQRIMYAMYSRRIGAAVVEELGLNSSQIDQMKDISNECLLYAGEKAMNRIKEESLKNSPNTNLFDWSPTVDGNLLPTHPFEVKTFRRSFNVPMLIGGFRNEFMTSRQLAAYKSAQQDAPVYMYLLDSISTIAELSSNVSNAWLSFVRNGEPEAEGVLSWPAYQPETGAVMVFNETSEIKYNMDEAIQTIINEKLNLDN